MAVSRYGINRATGRCRQCGRLQFRVTTDGRGRLVETPDPCACPKVRPEVERRAWARTVDRERRRACICQRCDSPTVGKPRVALYCEAHRVEARAAALARFKRKTGPEYQRETTRRYVERNREAVRQRARESYQDPEVRERRNEYKRQWRKANREKVRLQKERAALKHYRTNGDASERWRQRVAAGEHKPKPERRNQHGERLCCHGRCRQVVTGRAKMCERCKARLAAEAATALGARRAA